MRASKVSLFFLVALSPMLLWAVATMMDGGVLGLWSEMAARASWTYVHNGLLASALLSTIIFTLGLIGTIATPWANTIRRRKQTDR
ncbi:hypothetical protein ASE85_02845 [Sphingobium sp. Leaf26]|nr:hypothetical protein ASE85_02845 [Sphingobium sp. Leaf26]